MQQSVLPFQPTRRAFLGAVPLGLFGLFGVSGEAVALTNAQRIVAAARRQVGVTLSYDPAYTVLRFPNGDVDRAKGVCTDVVIRAFRDALGADLQALVNADMRANFAAYPKNWGLGRPDRNIDHRRVPNLATYWRRQGASLPVTTNPADWRPGDIFTAMVGGRLPHTGIVSDRKDTTGVPLVLHNIGGGTREEDALFDHKLTGHFRWKV
ncbi:MULTISPECIES: DUF1287 domain-containing protein [unclassified Sphingopyxis]|uniref:DUF1287 domain-containing protein n=1 Tax=unclassified Sphingopyxis TaxID=2614943 RepID=UPI0028676491|nr:MULTISPECIES: DUF1287 domain-containing protein [unclassified Sphingopyxis]MDR7062172.1 uncharacterized protein YijF (DUF1287 family) [Sphingopyxis sp. BE235]MDR7182630.1 uncharacterized protein YijF (DUF1287 family) [Sphingopyxis sp. BE249]